MFHKLKLAGMLFLAVGMGTLFTFALFSWQPHEAPFVALILVVLIFLIIRSKKL